jgi:hypothetical protein
MTADPTARDEVDALVEAWTRERPDLDVAPMRVLSRVTRLARHLDRQRAAAFSEPGSAMRSASRTTASARGPRATRSWSASSG